MLKKDKIAKLKKTSDKILAIISEGPKSQKEILNNLNDYLKDEGKSIELKVLSDHLKRLVIKKEIAYFGNTFTRLYPNMLLREKYGRKWPEFAQKFYFSTLKSGKLYKKLIKKFGRGNKDLIHEITSYYQAIEVNTQFQESEITETMKKDIERYYRARKRIVKFDFNNKEFLKFTKIIKMDPLMHWCAYKGGENMKNLTIPMYQKLRDLFIIVKGIKVIIPTDKFDTLNIKLKSKNSTPK